MHDQESPKGRYGWEMRGEGKGQLRGRIGEIPDRGGSCNHSYLIAATTLIKHIILVHSCNY